jgi:hypothetical protein
MQGPYTFVFVVAKNQAGDLEPASSLNKFEHGDIFHADLYYLEEQVPCGMPAVVTLGFWFFCRSTGCVDAQLLRLKQSPGSLGPAVSGLQALEAHPETSLDPC